MRFKTSAISAAVTAVLGAGGLVGSAQAVNVNPDGLGQAIIYPYYTVRNNQMTLFSVVNTTAKSKAVKVRFLEGKASYEVLDFNLYLSPNDMWAAAVTDNGTGAQIEVTDHSCTAPIIAAALTRPDGNPGPGAVAFRNIKYTADTADSSLDRTREGYIEVIEMGEVIDTYALNATPVAFGPAITHSGLLNGLPGNCAAINTAWDLSSGPWFTNHSGSVTAPTGGLAGSAHVINLSAGADISYDPTTLDNWSTLTSLHLPPGGENPSLQSAMPTTSNVFTSTSASVTSSAWDAGEDAVSAVLMKSSITNEYITQADLFAGTDWVVTFPTKRFYVSTSAVADPFEHKYTYGTGSCDIVTPELFGREEERTSISGLDFSPEPTTSTTSHYLCYEANVIRFNAVGSPGYSPLGSVTYPAGLGKQLVGTYPNGWARLTFPTDPDATVSATNHTLVSNSGQTYHGLPSVGFAVIDYAAGNGAALAGYGSSFNHKGTRTISGGG